MDSHPIRSEKELNQVVVPNAEEALDYVIQAVKQTKAALNNRVPLIGFAGSPWTLLCYAVQGQDLKTLTWPKHFVLVNPNWPIVYCR